MCPTPSDAADAEYDDGRYEYHLKVAYAGGTVVTHLVSPLLSTAQREALSLKKTWGQLQQVRATCIYIEPVRTEQHYGKPQGTAGGQSDTGGLAAERGAA